MTAFGRVGQTTLLSDGDVLVIEHSGNMGTNIEHVYKNVKKFYGCDVRKYFSLIAEEGSPDYYYRAQYILG